MAQITCSFSGVVFSCEHMPIALGSREYHHPLFSISKKKLISLAGHWSSGKLSPTESYLLYLSLLNSTDLIEWRVPAKYHSKTNQIIANNIESLIHIIGKIDLIHHPAFALPRFAISHDTCDLSNSYHWIQSWIENYNDWMDGYKHSSLEERQRLELRENALEKLIKTPYTSSKSSDSDGVNAKKYTKDELVYALSEWAALAGNFPVSLTPHHRTKKPIPIADYWKLIIRASISEERLWEFPKADIIELVEHCEENIIHGSVHAHTLMKVLRDGLKKYDDYLGFGDIDLAGRTTSFTILGSSNSAEEANIQALIQSAPTNEPKPEQYPTRFAYLKAKSKWMVAQTYKAKS